jgi:hypothetical protein
VLGAIVLGFDDIVAAEREKLPTPACPIIPLHLRPTLLAGVAIVERTGPEMLRMLRGPTPRRTGPASELDAGHTAQQESRETSRALEVSGTESAAPSTPLTSNNWSGDQIGP